MRKPEACLGKVRGAGRPFCSPHGAVQALEHPTAKRIPSIVLLYPRTLPPTPKPRHIPAKPSKSEPSSSHVETSESQRSSEAPRCQPPVCLIVVHVALRFFSDLPRPAKRPLPKPPVAMLLPSEQSSRFKVRPLPFIDWSDTLC